MIVSTLGFSRNNSGAFYIANQQTFVYCRWSPRRPQCSAGWSPWRRQYSAGWSPWRPQYMPAGSADWPVELVNSMTNTMSRNLRSVLSVSDICVPGRAIVLDYENPSIYFTACEIAWYFITFSGEWPDFILLTTSQQCQNSLSSSQLHALSIMSRTTWSCL